MMQLNTQTLVRWSLRLLGLLVISTQTILFLASLDDDNLPPAARVHPLLFEMVARGVIVLGFAAALRWERAGGAAIILGAVLLSMAIYAWASPLGAYASTLIAVHSFPALITGLLFLTMTPSIEAEYLSASEAAAD
jgi:hypothetical protein